MPQPHKTAAIMLIIINNFVSRAAVMPPSQLLLLFMLCLALPSRGLAHEPGTSQLEINLTDNLLTAQLTFAQVDIAAALQKQRPATLSATTISQEDFSAVQRLIANHFQLVHDSRHIRAHSIEIVTDQSKAVHIHLQYRDLPGTALQVQSDVFNVLPFGHRLFAQVATKDGLIKTSVLSTFNRVLPLSLPERPLLTIFQNFFTAGVWHIWIGYDHLLFLLTLLLPAVADRYRPEAGKASHARFNASLLCTTKVVTAFTVAHSLTLALNMFDMVNLPERWVESAIALSVLIAAANNLFNWVSHKLWTLAFVFGLLHGLGFASILAELAWESDKIPALLSFNLGVEVGQLTLVLLSFPILYRLRSMRIYQSMLLRNGSSVIAAIACVWLIERLTNQSWQQLLM